MVDAAIWLMVQGDRAGAEDLLVQVLKIEPEHPRAREALKSAAPATSPGSERPQPPIPHTTIPVLPPGAFAVPPGLHRRSPVVPASDLPFTSTPSALRASAPTVRLPNLTDGAPPPRRHEPPGGVSATHPRLDPVKSWVLEVLNGPNQGGQLEVKRPLVLGKGQGALDVESDFFISPGHASFMVRGAELWISDGGSTSGTWVSIDGPTRLAPGGSFSVGLQRMRYLGPLDTAAPADQPWAYGAPRPAASWRLEQVLVGDRPGRTWVLRGVVTLGREGATLRFPEDEGLAMVHAELRPAGHDLEVVDWSARLGTFVALPTGGERRLSEGQQVRLGSTLLRVTAR